MRYLFEVSYKGTHYAGFQVQENAITIQWQLEQVLRTFYKQEIALTGSSRTDAGVHALQNFFHADIAELDFDPKQVYNLNAMLPPDIVLKSMRPIPDNLHCRFHATHRLYQYHLYQTKNPFLNDRAWYFPYPLDLEKLNEAAALLMQYTDFTSFSKRNTQTKTMLCNIQESHWVQQGEEFVYTVKANRFLRGMVRGLVGTMLQYGRGKISLPEFISIIEAKDCTKADFTTPAHGLFLVEVGLTVP
jgi:tRNA pseudouridine38-40 synthase